MRYPDDSDKRDALKITTRATSIHAVIERVLDKHWNILTDQDRADFEAARERMASIIGRYQPWS